MTEISQLPNYASFLLPSHFARGIYCKTSRRWKRKRLVGIETAESDSGTKATKVPPLSHWLPLHILLLYRHNHHRGMIISVERVCLEIPEWFTFFTKWCIRISSAYNLRTHFKTLSGEKWNRIIYKLQQMVCSNRPIQNRLIQKWKYSKRNLQK